MIWQCDGLKVYNGLSLLFGRQIRAVTRAAKGLSLYLPAAHHQNPMGQHAQRHAARHITIRKNPMVHKQQADIAYPMLSSPLISCDVLLMTMLSTLTECRHMRTV